MESAYFEKRRSRSCQEEVEQELRYILSSDLPSGISRVWEQCIVLGGVVNPDSGGTFLKFRIIINPNGGKIIINPRNREW